MSFFNFFGLFVVIVKNVDKTLYLILMAKCDMIKARKNH